MAEDVTKLPSVAVLASLVSQVETMKAKSSTINGELGEKIASAVDKHNLHAGAFKLMCKLKKMDAVKLMAWLTHFDDYREKLQLDKLVAADLPGMDEAEAASKKPMFDDKKEPDGVGLDGQPASSSVN